MTPKLKIKLDKARPIIEDGNKRNESYDILAKRLKVTRSTVSNYCRFLGIKLKNRLKRNRKVSYDGWDTLIYSMRQRNMNQTQIAKELKVAPSTITKWKHK